MQYLIYALLPYLVSTNWWSGNETVLGSASQRQQDEDACFQEAVWWSQGVPVGAEGKDG